MAENETFDEMRNLFDVKIRSFNRLSFAAAIATEARANLIVAQNKSSEPFSPRIWCHNIQIK